MQNNATKPKSVVAPRVGAHEQNGSHEAVKEEKPKPEATPENSLRTRLAKIGEMQELSFKLSKLQKTESELNTFVIGSDRFKDTLSIADGQGHDFETNNTDVISEVLAVIKAIVKRKIGEIEHQILSAQI